MIGTGGFGTVVLATQLELNRTVVVKLLRMERLTDAETLQRFRDEARLTARLRHPNIVVVHDHGDDDGVPWIVYEHLQGRTLKDRLIEEGRLPAAQAVRVAIQVCAALEEAHAHDALHRDIKPENIFEDQDGHCKVLDFGIARWVGGALRTPTGMIFGTAAYIAPEQARGERATAKADLYSLGVTLFELLTGGLPFWDDNAMLLLERHIKVSPPKPSSRCADVPPELDELVLKAMAKDPAERFATAAQMRAALQRWLSSFEAAAELHAPAVSPPPRPPSRGRAHKLAAMKLESSRMFRRTAFPVGATVLAMALIAGIAGARWAVGPGTVASVAVSASPAGPPDRKATAAPGWNEAMELIGSLRKARYEGRNALTRAYLDLKAPADDIVVDLDYLDASRSNVATLARRAWTSLNTSSYRTTALGRPEAAPGLDTLGSFVWTMGEVEHLALRVLLARLKLAREILGQRRDDRQSEVARNPARAIDLMSQFTLSAEDARHSVNALAAARMLASRLDEDEPTLDSSVGDIVEAYFVLADVLRRHRAEGPVVQAIARDTAELAAALSRPVQPGRRLRTLCHETWQAAQLPPKPGLERLRRAKEAFLALAPAATGSLERAFTMISTGLHAP